MVSGGAAAFALGGAVWPGWIEEDEVKEVGREGEDLGAVGGDGAWDGV